MGFINKLAMLGLALGLALSLAGGLVGAPARAADILDPTPMQEQTRSGQAVDGLNFKFSGLGGVLGERSNGMFVASIASPLPFIPSFGFQGDMAIGVYDGDETSAAGALHIFWRDPGVGMVGIYGDWGYLSPEHGGRVGLEVARYDGPWSLDGMFAVQFGQNLYTKFVDEVDLAYYLDDNTKVSLGHRYMSRGHLANLSFEHQFGAVAGVAWSLYGEVEGGEDDYIGAFIGLRGYLGSTGSSTLIGRDRHDGVMVRIPRNLASMSQCGYLDTPKPATHWRSKMSILCASKDEINAVSSSGPTNP